MSVLSTVVLIQEVGSGGATKSRTDLHAAEGGGESAVRLAVVHNNIMNT